LSLPSAVGNRRSPPDSTCPRSNLPAQNLIRGSWLGSLVNPAFNRLNKTQPSRPDSQSLMLGSLPGTPTHTHTMLRPGAPSLARIDSPHTKPTDHSRPSKRATDSRIHFQYETSSKEPSQACSTSGPLDFRIGPGADAAISRRPLRWRLLLAAPLSTSMSEVCC
jgi:hypothetical protein